MPCSVAPIPSYEGLSPQDAKTRLLTTRAEYEANMVLCQTELDDATTDEDKQAAQDSIDAIRSALTNLNNLLIDIDDAVATNDAELRSTFMGTTRDKLYPTTRRTRPLGTVFTDWDAYGWTWDDKTPVTALDPLPSYDLNIVDDIPKVDLSGIDYTESTSTQGTGVKEVVEQLLELKSNSKVDLYDKEHESCLKDLPCTFKAPIVEADDIDYTGYTDVDVTIPITEITSGCANGDGLFDKLMTSVDASINLQYKNNRLDAKTFAGMYAQVIQSSLQETTSFLLETKKLELAKAELLLKQEKASIDKATAKFDIELKMVQLYIAKKKLPLELSKLTQETKNSEMEVELTKRQIEQAEAQTTSAYNGVILANKRTEQELRETRLNGVLDRNNIEAGIENLRVRTKTARFDTILKKHQAYAAKISSEESKATGKVNRRMLEADTRSKMKQASLYDQQRKSYVAAHRVDVLKVAKDMWSIQLDSVGAENMVVEAIKGREMSSRVERALIDAGM